MNYIGNQNLWVFELCSQQERSVPKNINLGSPQIDRQDSQDLFNCSFCTLPITSVQGIISTENYPDVGHMLNFDDDGYSQGYGHF